MKIIIITLFTLNTFITLAMDAPKERRKSCSPGRMHTLLARSQSSMTPRTRTSVQLKTPESASAVHALITHRSTPEQKARPESPKASISVARSDSRDLRARASENNRNNFVKMIMRAHVDIKNMKALDDEAYKQYQIDIKEARYYCSGWLSLVVTSDPASLKHLVDQELYPTENEFDNKKAFITAIRK